MTVDFSTAVREVLLALGEGEVVSYGEVAEQAGFPGAARAVGTLLRNAGAAPAEQPLPWWRVVAANGRLVPGHEAEQAARLRAEGVTIAGGRVRTS